MGGCLRGKAKQPMAKKGEPFNEGKKTRPKEKDGFTLGAGVPKTGKHF